MKIGEMKGRGLEIGEKEGREMKLQKWKAEE